MYGAAMCSDVARERIERVYSHDGPGFVEEFLNGNAFADLSGRIDKTLPRSSIFGMMFETQEDYAIVESTEFSLLQHNPLAGWLMIATSCTVSACPPVLDTLMAPFARCCLQCHLASASVL